MLETFKMIAKTLQGLEGVLAGELAEMGAGNIEPGRRMVAFEGDKETMYRANFGLRTALRILKPIKTFEASNPDEVYETVRGMEWEEMMDTGRTFAVDAVTYGQEFRHSKFVAYRVKDAVADRFRQRTGRRPGVRVNRPDLQLHLHIAGRECTLALDSSGESLHRRGYRQEAVEAPLNEVLAAGMILMTGWRGETDLIDPMCGSGTLPVEAALIARNMAPGLFRKEFAFERWTDFDRDLLERIYNDDSREREFGNRIYGYDISPKACDMATRNVRAAGVARQVTIEQRDFRQFERPAKRAVIVTNPPYGERITTEDLPGLYRAMGERLKHAFAGNTAWILSNNEECMEQIGLRPARKIPLMNGGLECEFRKYEMFEGKRADQLTIDN